jgi:hypothetical protein
VKPELKPCLNYRELSWSLLPREKRGARAVSKAFGFLTLAVLARLTALSRRTWLARFAMLSGFPGLPGFALVADLGIAGFPRLSGFPVGTLFAALFARALPELATAFGAVGARRAVALATIAIAAIAATATELTVAFFTIVALGARAAGLTFWATLAGIGRRLGLFALPGVRAFGCYGLTFLCAVFSVVILGLLTETLVIALLELRRRLGRLHGTHDAEVVFGVLEIAFGHHPVARGVRVPRKLQILLVDVRGAAPHLHIRPSALEGAVGGHMTAATSAAAAGLATPPALPLVLVLVLHVRSHLECARPCPLVPSRWACERHE